MLLRRPVVTTGALLLTGTLTAAALANCGAADETVRAAAPKPRATPAATPSHPKPKASLYGGLIGPPSSSDRPGHPGPPGRRGERVAESRSEPEPGSTRGTRTPGTGTTPPAPEPPESPEAQRLAVVIPAQGAPTCGPPELTARPGETWIFVIKARRQATVTVAGHSFDTAAIAETDSGTISAEVAIDEPGTYPVTTDPALESPCAIVIR
ncbi:MAG: hypothetical protein GEV11_10930 [Streptosporangiales bacterium]|nr:hypothetical protein [Streptosporangiales bacterium]